AMLMADWASSITSGERAIAMARSVGAADVQSHAEVTLGTSLARYGNDRRDEGLRLLRSAIDSAKAQRAFQATNRGFVNLCEELRSRSSAYAQRTATAEFVAYARTLVSPYQAALCCEADPGIVD